MEEVLFSYEKYKEPKLYHRRFKHKDIEKLITRSRLESSEIGHSHEGRAIYQIKFGNGPIKVLLWSQMHGNEATATMALFDIFNFLQSKDEQDFKIELAQKLTLYFVPMLNPDGAERFERRTAQQIDMNRDALDQVCPESRLLVNLQKKLKPHFSFNLHDQDVKYAAGLGSNQAAITFLATAYNQERSWNENRTKAAQVIVQMNTFLQNSIPKKVGRFSDEFEPRAFGDNIQKWGSSLILIESGGNGTDREKMELRRLNYEIILLALQSIARRSYVDKTIEAYQDIPENTRCLFDILIRNVELENGENVSIGINLTENNNRKATKYSLSSVIEDLGDLSTFWGIQEFDAKGMKAVAFEHFPELLKVPYKYAKGVQFGEKAYFVLTQNGKPQKIVLDGILKDI